MKKLVVLGWIFLFYVELLMTFRNLETLHKIVREQRSRLPSDLPTRSIEQLCLALDYASVFYFKKILCLQRSAATTMLLRCYGWSARMITGAQVLPFRSHAWVEIHGDVVNDKPYMREIYQVLDEC
jgi:Transglutaminase-like superfamily